jgi:hypothetical protein
MGWLPACKDVSPEEEEHPPLEAITMQRSQAQLRQSRIESEVRQWTVEWSLQFSEATPARTEAAEHGS